MQKKTVAVLFNKNSTQNISGINIKNHPVSWSNQAKYLGVLLDKNLNFNAHVRETNKKAIRIRGVLNPIINRKNPVANKTKLLMYQIYIRSGAHIRRCSLGTAYLPVTLAKHRGRPEHQRPHNNVLTFLRPQLCHSKYNSASTK